MPGEQIERVRDKKKFKESKNSGLFPICMHGATESKTGLIGTKDSKNKRTAGTTSG